MSSRYSWENTPNLASWLPSLRLKPYRERDARRPWAADNQLSCGEAVAVSGIVRHVSSASSSQTARSAGVWVSR